MKQLFLTSEVANTGQHLAEHLDRKPKDVKLLFITTASEPEGQNLKWLAQDKASLEKAGFKVTNYSFTNSSKKEIAKTLSKTDFVFVNGGNTFYLLKKAQESGFTRVIHDFVNSGGIYGGSSAGSILAGPDIWPSHRIDKPKIVDLKSHKGLNLVNFIVFPHWGSDRFKKLYLNHRLEHAYKEDQHPIVLLTDNQYVYVQDNKYQIIDITK